MQYALSDFGVQKKTQQKHNNCCVIRIREEYYCGYFSKII